MDQHVLNGQCVYTKVHYYYIKNVVFLIIFCIITIIGGIGFALVNRNKNKRDNVNNVNNTNSEIEVPLVSDYDSLSENM